LAAVPAVIAAALDDVDLLERVLADVAEPELAGRRIEAPAPRVPQAPREDLRAIVLREIGVRRAARLPGEWIVRRDPVRRGRAADVDPEHLAEQRAGPLRVAIRVAAGAAVTEADVEIAVRPEFEMTAVVVRERLRQAEHVLPRAGRERRAAVLARVPRDDRRHRRAL